MECVKGEFIIIKVYVKTENISALKLKHGFKNLSNKSKTFTSDYANKLEYKIHIGLQPYQRYLDVNTDSYLQSRLR